MSWGYLNDSYRSRLCLYYPGNIIVTACVYLSLRKLNLSVGSCPWWGLLEANLDIMKSVGADILNIYESRTDYYGAESIIKKIC